MSILSRWTGRLKTRRQLRDSAARAVATARSRWRSAAKGTAARASAYRALKAQKARLATREAQVREAEAVVRRHTPLDEVVAFDGVPVPRGLALAFGDARRHGWKGSLSSGDRRRGVAERYGKSSQWKLWDGWNRRLPGFNPANPPGRSSHERRSDGSLALSRLGPAYRVPVGAVLKWWQQGTDATLAADLVLILNRLGYSVVRPYSDPRETHHLNFKVNPEANLRKRGLI